MLNQNVNRILLSLLLLFCYVIGNSQNNRNIDEKYRYYERYVRLDEARTMNPDSVLYLDIGSMGLKEFPNEVLKYKNLKELSLTNFTELTACKIGVMDSANCVSIIKKDNELKKRFGIAYDEGMPMDEKLYKPNEILKIPEKIKELKYLKLISVINCWPIKISNQMPKEMIKKLIEWLPNCYIEQPYEDLDVSLDIDSVVFIGQSFRGCIKELQIDTGGVRKLKNQKFTFKDKETIDWFKKIVFNQYTPTISNAEYEKMFIDDFEYIANVYNRFGGICEFYVTSSGKIVHSYYGKRKLPRRIRKEIQ
jgi:hypothetical protein